MAVIVTRVGKGLPLTHVEADANFNNLNAEAATNTAKVTNATHTGDVTGDTALTIAAGSVTLAKQANVATSTLLGRVTAATGVVEALTPAQGRTVLGLAAVATSGSAADLSAGLLPAARFDDTAHGARAGGTTHANAVAAGAAGFMTGADKTKLDGIATGAQVNVATNLTYTAGTRALASSTGTGATLPLFTSTDPGLVPLSGGGTANFLRADGTFAAPAGGGDMVLASAQTNSALKTFLSGTFGLRNVANTFTALFTNAITAARTYTLKDADGTIAFTSDITGTNSGTNTGDNAVNSLYSGLVSNATHTGEVTGATALTITAAAVTLAHQANMATASVVYRKTAAAGPPEVQTLATLKTDLGLTGTNSGDQTITLTADVTGTGVGSFAATIAAGAVTLAKQANLAANSVIGNATGSVAVPAAVALSSAAVASSVVLRDASANTQSNNSRQGYTTTATAALTTALAVGSTYLQFFTGTTTQTVTLPDVTTLALGHQFYIRNTSTGLVTVNSSGGNLLRVLGPNTRCLVTCILITGITAASWATIYFGTSVADGKVLTANNSLTLSGTDGNALSINSATASVSNANTGDQTITLTGDVGGTGTGSFATTLATVNANVGSFGLATSVAQFTVNAKGLITAAVNVAISIASTAISDSTAAGRAMLTAATAAAQTALLSVFVPSGAGSAKGLVPDPGVTMGITRYLREDGTWVTPAGVGDMVLATAQTNVGLKTFMDGSFGLRNVLNTFTGLFTNSITAARTYTLKDASGTIAFTTDITGVNSGTNTGDQPSIVGITGTKAQFNTAVTDGDILYVGDAPTAHTHVAANVTDFSAAADARIGAASINALADVVITTPALNQVVKFDGTNWTNQADATGGVTDGDKGDITASAAGATWRVDPNIKYGLPIVMAMGAFNL